MMGNTSAFSSEAQREALDRMTLSTRAAAAEKLYLTQPALSMAVRQEEKQLGARGSRLSIRKMGRYVS